MHQHVVPIISPPVGVVVVRLAPAVDAGEMFVIRTIPLPARFLGRFPQMDPLRRYFYRAFVMQHPGEQHCFNARWIGLGRRTHIALQVAAKNRGGAVFSLRTNITIVRSGMGLETTFRVLIAKVGDCAQFTPLEHTLVMREMDRLTVDQLPGE